MPRIVTRPVIASIASVTRLRWRSVVVSRHWLKHATTSIMSGMGGCSWCRVGVGLPYSTRCSAALPHRHFGEGIDVWDNVNVAFALGYHTANARGIPYGFVFTELSRQLGESWT